MSPKAQTEATNGRKKKKKKTGQACEIPNRTGKNNIINYGSPQAASGQALCGTSPGTRRARVSSVVRACGWQGPLRPPWGDESRAHPGTQGTATPSRPSSDRLCWRGSPSVGRACGPQGRAGQAGRSHSTRALSQATDTQVVIQLPSHHPGPGVLQIPASTLGPGAGEGLC